MKRRKSTDRSNATPAAGEKNLYLRIRDILESARAGVARTVNTTQVAANWLTGREIVEEEHCGESRAEDGKRLIAELSEKLTADFGLGYSVQNLFYIKPFHGTYPLLIAPGILPALREESDEPENAKKWEQGHLSPNLSWTHYRTLPRVQKSAARAFHEIEAIRNNWFARALEGQINSLLFERLAKSKDKTRPV